MKKLGILMGVLIILIGTVFFVVNANKVDENEVYKPIDGVSFERKIDSKESFVLYVYGENCGACTTFAPQIEGYLNERNYQINKIVTDIDAKNAQSVYQVLGDKAQGTPSIFVFEDGELIDYLVGYKEFEQFAQDNDAFFSKAHTN